MANVKKALKKAAKKLTKKLSKKPEKGKKKSVSAKTPAKKAGPKSGTGKKGSKAKSARLHGKVAASEEDVGDDLPPADADERIDDEALDDDLLVAEVERELNTKLPEDERPDTVGGLLMAELDDIPKPGDVAEIGGLRFTVQALEGRRITRVRIERPDLKPDEPGQAVSDAV